MPKVALHRLELHASHACNLTCESCSHYSNHGFTGLIAPDEAERQMALWAPRLDPEIFSVMGGEPTLNPKLLEVVAAAVRHFPRVEVASNGFFLLRHPELGRVLSEAKEWGRLVLSVHGDDYPQVVEAAIKCAESWEREYGIRIQIRRYSTARPWTRRYQGYGPSMRPYDHGNPTASHAICPAASCVQLHGGKLWKCPIMAYLPMMAERFPELAAPWSLGLAYKPLSPEASHDELQAFVNRQAEPVCGLCPGEPQPFLPQSPLIQARALLRAAAPAAETSNSAP